MNMTKNFNRSQVVFKQGQSIQHNDGIYLISHGEFEIKQTIKFDGQG